MRLELRGGLGGLSFLDPQAWRFIRYALRDALGADCADRPNHPVAACQAPLLRLGTALTDWRRSWRIRPRQSPHGLTAGGKPTMVGKAAEHIGRDTAGGERP